MARRAPHERSTAHRPLLRNRGRRALSNVGGAIERAGDVDLAAGLADALTVAAGERDATLTHPFHAYPARLHPEIARRLVALATRDRSVRDVLDPCCGSGTVLVEAMVAGCTVVGTDLSPLAAELARIKTRRTDAGQRRAVVDEAHRLARVATSHARGGQRAPVPRGESEWFSPPVLRELAALRALIAEEPPGLTHDAMRMLFSSVLVKVSRQRSDSDPRRVFKSIAPGSTLRLFAMKSLELTRGLDALASSTTAATPEPDVRVDDATTLATVADASIDVVITSPPYANTYDYVTHHERRYAWLDLDASALASREIGAARWFDVPEAGVLRFARELSQFCRAIGRVLRPTGRAFVVMADGAAGDLALRAEEMLAKAALDAKLRVLARASQPRPTFDPVSARAFRKQPKREHLVVLGR